MRALIAPSLALGLLLALSGTSSFAIESKIVRPNTPEATKCMKQLANAVEADRGNSMGWSDDNPGLDHYYARKLTQVEQVLAQMRSGQPVPKSAIDQALNNDQAATYGAAY